MTFRMTRENELNFIAKACRDNEEVYASIMPGAFMRQAEKYLEKGLPKAYTLFTIEKTREDGLQDVVLLVHQDAAWARKFYERYGLKIIGETYEEMVAFDSRFSDLYIKNTVMMRWDLWPETGISAMSEAMNDVIFKGGI